jgi:hypothetical protein
MTDQPLDVEALRRLQSAIEGGAPLAGLGNAAIRQLPAILAALEERDRLRAMSTRLEWQGSTSARFRCCPWCDGMERDGHEPGCELGAVAREGIRG